MAWLVGVVGIPPKDTRRGYVPSHLQTMEPWLTFGSMVSSTTITKATGTTLPTALPSIREMVRWWLAGKSERTVEAYRADLRALAAHLGIEDATEAVSRLLGGGPVHGMAMASAWVEAMEAAGLSPATINRRMASLRSLSRLLHLATGWTLQTPTIRSVKYRDTRGPGRDGVLRLLRHAANNPDPRKASRDVAVVRLLHDLGLRRGEVASLDLADLDMDRGTINVMGKGRREEETFTVPAPTMEALRVWVRHRGGEPGPLITNLDRRTKGGRLTPNGIHHLVSTLGKAVGLVVRPHGLRHAAITAALDATGGDVRRVSRYSRHRDIKTVMVYDDARVDLGGGVATMVAFDTITTMDQPEPMGARGAR